MVEVWQVLELVYCRKLLQGLDAANGFLSIVAVSVSVLHRWQILVQIDGSNNRQDDIIRKGL